MNDIDDIEEQAATNRDAALLSRAAQLRDRGIRGGRLVADEDVFEARYMVPALLEIIERRGLRPPAQRPVRRTRWRELCDAAGLIGAGAIWFGLLVWSGCDDLAVLARLRRRDSAGRTRWRWSR
jgi:hypothetical protein